MKQLLRIIFILLGISFISFLLMYLSPGDPVRAMFAVSGNIPSEEVLNEIRTELGLNRPFIIQYFDWLGSCLQGDFGTSYSTNQPVLQMLFTRLLPTLKITFLSLFFMIILAIPLGVISALNQNKFWDYLMRFITFIGISMPNFWLGIVLLYVFSIKLGLLPVVSTSDGIERLILPAFTLAFAMAGKYARQIRASILEELHQDYVVGAKSRGLSQNRIIWCHVMKNAILPLITMLGLSIGSLLGGTAVVEIIFSYSGLGTLALSAITSMDYPLIQGYVLWVALIYMLVNIAVDFSYKSLDPRIKKGLAKHD